MKKGFTLIELLAVIVILAIIALIATPLVLKYIEKSRDDSRLRSAENYVNAVEKAVVNQNMKGEKFNPNTCTVTDKKLYCDGTLLEVNIKGVKPDDGSYITFNNEKIEDVKLLYDDKIIVNDENNKLVYGDNIELLEPGLYDDNNKLLASWDELVDKYGLDIETNYTTKTYEASGSMYAVLNNNSEFKKATKLVIGDNVQKIGNYAFYNCDKLKRISMPDSITVIGTVAFQDCTNLKSIKLSESITEIKLYTFQNCSSLTELIIPESVIKISSPFIGTALKSIHIPKNVAKITNTSFNGCSNLETITVDEENTVFDSRDNSNAIIETATNKLVIGSNNTIIPDSVVEIGYHAFNGRTKLKSMSFPASVKTIGASAFKDCDSLTEIYIPETISLVDERSFSGCDGLEKIIVDINNSKYDSRDNSNAIIETVKNELVVGCKNTIIPNSITNIGSGAFYEIDSLKTIDIPEGVTTISDEAFRDCSSLTKVNLPDSLITIGKHAFSYCSNLEEIAIPKSTASIGDFAFAYCDSLSKINVAEENTIFDSRDNSNAIIQTSTNTLINGCQNTIIPTSVTSIGNYAFQGHNNLKNINIPNTITSIGVTVFAYCTGLESITIPDSVTSIGSNTFQFADNLKTIYYKGAATGAPWGATNATVVSDY